MWVYQVTVKDIKTGKYVNHALFSTIEKAHDYMARYNKDYSNYLAKLDGAIPVN